MFKIEDLEVQTKTSDHDKKGSKKAQEKVVRNSWLNDIRQGSFPLLTCSLYLTLEWQPLTFDAMAYNILVF